MRTLLLATLCGSFVPALAGSIAGYYASASAHGPIWRELCITELPSKQYRVVMFTSYCPSVECGNLRMDSAVFVSRVGDGKLSHINGLCNIEVRVAEGRATVVQAGECGQQGRLISSGNYAKRDTEVREDDCTPQSGRN